MNRRPNHRVYFVMGTNIDQIVNMQNARRHLKSLFKELHFSTEVWTEPIGIDSEPFLNCMGVGVTRHECTQILRALKQIQRKCGDSKGKRRVRQIVMDIDMMQFDDERFHEEDWQRDYVQRLYKELQHIDNALL